MKRERPCASPPGFRSARRSVWATTAPCSCSQRICAGPHRKHRKSPGEQQSETRAYLLRSALVDRIAAGSRVEVPETMIHERALSMARSLEQRLEQDQSSMEEYYKACHTDREHLLADFAQAAEDQLRARLTLLAIARAEGLDATEAEYDAEVARLSGMYLMPEEKLRPLLAHREGIKIRQDIAISKAADWVAAKSGSKRRQLPETEKTTARAAIPARAVLSGFRGPKALRFRPQNPDDFFHHRLYGVFRMNHRYRSPPPQRR
ncbi:hypothetical protein [Ruthenibacterium lactatiformans]|uniref:hypothetical protein n=1 Tax=Ruthenibacterium lactatiformans TaxID=1550024 RepID=UPI0035230837